MTKRLMSCNGKGVLLLLCAIPAALAGCQLNQPDPGLVMQKLRVEMPVHDVDLMMQSEGAVLMKVEDIGEVFQNRYYHVGGKMIVVCVGYRPFSQEHRETLGRDRVVASWKIVDEKYLETCESIRPEDLKFTIEQVPSNVPAPNPADGAK